MIVIVYHSASGRTRALAEAIARTSGGTAMSVDAVDDDALAAAEAIVLGCPTYMGSASAGMKAFMDRTAPIWALEGWKDKLAAGFTHSAAPSGDKLGTLVQLATFAAQHGMVWVGLGLPPTYASGEISQINRLGSHLGLMAQTRPGAALDPGDVRTAELFGERIAAAVARWGTRAAAADPARHRHAAHWAVPPARAGRMNLRELGSRPERFEHHLVPVATIGSAQLELAVASEPLYFAHVNISDEYALALPSGDELVDKFPLRTFVSDGGTRSDVGRYNHRVGEMVLHPVGLAHWPGRLRPPYELPPFPPSMRRTGLSLVYCATVPTPSAGVVVEVTGDERAKPYVTPAPPLSIVDVKTRLGVIARVANTAIEVIEAPVVLPKGGWVVDLVTLDLERVPEGGTAGVSMTRALVFASADVAPDPIPPAWRGLPEPAFPPFEDGERAPLPLRIAGVTVREVSDKTVEVRIGDSTTEVPRHWAARTLFRLGLHHLRLGSIETYGGLRFDDRADLVIAIPGASVTIPRASALDAVERLYRAIAPPGYTERLP